MLTAVLVILAAVVQQLLLLQLLLHRGVDHTVVGPYHWFTSVGFINWLGLMPDLQ